MLDLFWDAQRGASGARAQQKEASLAGGWPTLGAKPSPRAPAVPQCRRPESLSMRFPRVMTLGNELGAPCSSTWRRRALGALSGAKHSCCRSHHEGLVEAEWLQQEPHYLRQAAAAVDGLVCPGASLAPAVHHVWKNGFSLRVLKSTMSVKICGMSAAINPALQIQIMLSLNLLFERTAIIFCLPLNSTASPWPFFSCSCKELWGAAGSTSRWHRNEAQECMHVAHK